MSCTPCLSLWERWLGEAKPERENRGAAPSQSPSVILVFNKTVKNRFIRLLFQQPAA